MMGDPGEAQTLPRSIEGDIQLSPGRFIVRVVRRIKTEINSNAFGEHSSECIDASGVVSIGGKQIPVQTGYWGDVLVWTPKDGVSVPNVDH
jgi:hypothetical protein